MSRKFRPLVFFSFILALLFSVTVVAQEQSVETYLEEILITGELRTTDQFKLANSVSVIGEDQIETRNATNLEDLLNIAPNVNYSTGASRGRFIQIRGIGERSQFVAPINPSVGVIVDGIDFTGIATGVSALDAQQVEVFRGPQGTLYGANALAGMINVVGNGPSDFVAGEVAAGFGNYGSYDASAMFNTPVGDSAGWRIAAQKNVSDGYIENDFLNRNDTNNLDELSLRNHFAYQISDQLKADLISYYIDVDNGYDAFSLDNNRTTLSDEPGHDRQTSYAHALKSNFTGFSIADINAVISYASSDIEYGYDEDWSYREICAADSDCGYWQYSTTDNYQRENDNTSADIRLVSKNPEADIVWAAGVYQRDQNVDLVRIYKNNDPDYDFYSPISAPEISLYNSDYSTRSRAIYGQVDVNLSDRVTLIGGLRKERFKADFDDSQNAEFKPRENLWGGKLALEYLTHDNTLLYGLISRGYKAGGFNPDADLEDAVKTFTTETMLNYEIGAKGQWLDSALKAQLAAFYQQRDDIQVKQSRAYPEDGVFTFVDFIANAASGNNYGLEAEVNWMLNDSLALFATLALLETEYSDFINLSHVDRNEETGEGYGMNGRAQAHAPEFQYFVAAQYDFTVPLYIRVELEGKDGFYFSESHNETSSSFNLLNLRMAYEFGDTTFALWGKNLTDETIETRGFYFSHDFGNDPRKLYAPEPYTQKGAPLTYGASIKHKF